MSSTDTMMAALTAKAAARRKAQEAAARKHARALARTEKREAEAQARAERAMAALHRTDTGLFSSVTCSTEGCGERGENRVEGRRSYYLACPAHLAATREYVASQA